MNHFKTKTEQTLQQFKDPELENLIELAIKENHLRQNQGTSKFHKLKIANFQTKLEQTLQQFDQVQLQTLIVLAIEENNIRQNHKTWDIIIANITNFLIDKWYEEYHFELSNFMNQITLLKHKFPLDYNRMTGNSVPIIIKINKFNEDIGKIIVSKNKIIY